MGYLQGRLQDSDLRWKAVLDQDGDVHPSSALRAPNAPKLASLEIPGRRRSVCPPPDLPSTARSDSMPAHERAASDVSTLPEDTNPFCHMRSSMGRLCLQDSGEISRKMPLRVIGESTAGNHVRGHKAASESERDSTTSSAFLPETRPPISIRSHVEAQLKGPDQDRNGMRIRRSHQFGPPDISRAKDRHKIGRENIDHYLPTITKEMENNGSLPKHGNMTSYIRQRKQRPVFGGLPKFPVQDYSGSSSPGQDAQMRLAAFRDYQRQALDSSNGHYSSPLRAKNHNANTGDKNILPVGTESKLQDPYASMKGGSFSKFKPSPQHRVDGVTSGGRFDTGALTTSGSGQMPLLHTGNGKTPTYKDANRPEQRPMGWAGRLKPDLYPAIAPGGGTGTPAVPYNFLSTPPYMGLPRPPPGEGPSSFANVKETELPRASNSSRNNSPQQHGNQGHARASQSRPKPQCWEHGCNGRQFSTFSNLLRHQREKSGQIEASCPDCEAEGFPTRPRNGHMLNKKCKHKRQPFTGSNAIDGTKGMNSTISKDSSADECVRQAKLLADMGGRSQGPAPVPQQDAPRVPSPAAHMNPFADVGHYPHTVKTPVSTLEGGLGPLYLPHLANFRLVLGVRP